METIFGSIIVIIFAILFVKAGNDDKPEGAAFKTGCLIGAAIFVFVMFGIFFWSD